MDHSRRGRDSHSDFFRFKFSIPLISDPDMLAQVRKTVLMLLGSLCLGQVRRDQTKSAKIQTEKNPPVSEIRQSVAIQTKDRYYTRV